MRGLNWIAAFLLMLVLQFAPSAAAERVLLPQGSQSAAAPADAGAALSPGAIQGLRATALKAGKVKVIVGLRVPFAPAAALPAAEARLQEREITTAARAVRARLGARLAPGSLRAFETVPFLAAEVTVAELEALAADPSVLSLTEDMLLRPTLFESARLIRAPEAWEAGYTGSGQVIAILDTGIDMSHPFLAGKVVSEACYARDGSCPGNTSSSLAAGSGGPCNGTFCEHGTLVAGIAAGLPRGTLSGIAPAAGLISVRIYSPSVGGIYASDLLSGLERVYALRGSYSIAAANLSLGFAIRQSTSCDGISPAFTAMFAQLRAAGIAPVAASGNDGDARAISFPACIASAVSVGAVSDSNWGACTIGGSSASTAADKVACYSNSAPILSLLAPGSAITSAVPGGGYSTEHGTSMAAPHVAAAFAIIREKAPNASVGDILEALRSTGRTVRDYRSTSIATPRIDVKAALDSFEADDGKLPLSLSFVGTGRGSVTFSPASTRGSCTANCSSRFVPGQAVTLTAAPAANVTFAGWSGACSGAGACIVTMTAAQRVSAIFHAVSGGPPQQLTISRAGAGPGIVAVVADGITTSCSGTCTRMFGEGTTVQLTAVPEPGKAAASWSGACKGRKASCVVRMSGPKSVSANFDRIPALAVSYAKAGAGAGTVEFTTSWGDVMSCGTNCSNAFGAGATVRLTARPAPGRSFGGWTGACRGMKSSCSFRLKSAIAVTATFN